ncbi:MAG: glycosyltransferase family 2 protein [Phormidesmis sp.]
MVSSLQSTPLVSIIINNYNYAEFLNDAIESALCQSYSNIEVILVDDGSCDHSISVIDRYRDQIICLQKNNGGQASAMNYGFSICRGEFVLFLDSDDFLCSSAVSLCIQKVTEKTEKISKVQAPLEIKSKRKKLDGKRFPSQPLRSGSLREFILEHGPASYPSPPTSGNLWSRQFLLQVFPIPELLYRKSADAYLFTLAPLFGQFMTVESPIGKYRLHERNNYWNSEINAVKLRYEICQYRQRCLVMEKFAKLQGEYVDCKRWRIKHRYYLAKIISLWKIRGSKYLPISFGRFNYAVMSSNISLYKKVAWLVWFLVMLVVPCWLSRTLVRAFISLSFRV